MSRTLRFHSAVAGDVAAAIIWYRNNRPGLDADFQREFDALLAAIERNPLQYQLVELGLRRAMLHGFPYAVMYTISEEEILIVGCRHARRNPAEWRRRLE
jgi:plasmid stabilization system protein ParE